MPLRSIARRTPEQARGRSGGHPTADTSGAVRRPVPPFRRPPGAVRHADAGICPPAHPAAAVISVDPGVHRLPRGTGLAGHLRNRGPVEHLEHRAVAGAQPSIAGRLPDPACARQPHRIQRAADVQDVPGPSSIIRDRTVQQPVGLPTVNRSRWPCTSSLDHGFRSSGVTIEPPGKQRPAQPADITSEQRGDYKTD